MDILIHTKGITPDNSPELAAMLEGYDCAAILVNIDYQVMATNQLYKQQFGDIQATDHRHCYEVSHGYSVPCDQAGESCPLNAAQVSGHRERVLHIHQTPRGKEHVDVELLPIAGHDGQTRFFIELLRTLPIASTYSSIEKMVGSSPPFTHMLSNITRVAQSEASVLLIGESGTGKELAAQAIHDSSARTNKPLVSLECAGLSEALFESELFGHVKGAFTGAHSSKRGLVELASGGTLFLDEIGDVPLAIQVKLLRLLESGTYRVVGNAEVKLADFRLICATHKNIKQMISIGEFRQDLFYRINVFPLAVPSLRARIADLPVLIDTLLQRISPKKEFHFTASAMQHLKSYHFPGNIRELRNLLTRMILLTDTNVIEKSSVENSMSIDQLFVSLTKQTDHSYMATNVSSEPLPSDLTIDLKTAEKQYLSSLLNTCDGNKTRAASIAGISLRSLYRKLEQ